MFFKQGTGGGENQAVVFDLATNETLASLDLGIESGFGSNIGNVVISPDGTRAFVAINGSNRIWAIDLIHLTLANGGDPINISADSNVLVLTDDGQFLLVADYESLGSTISVVSLQTLSQVSTFELPGPIFNMDVGPGGVILVALDNATIEIRKYTIDSEGTISDSGAVYSTSETFILYNITISPDGQHAVLSNVNGAIEILNVSTLQNASTFTSFVAFDTIFSADGTKLYALSTNGLVRGYEFNPVTGQIGLEFLATNLDDASFHVTSINRLAISDDGKFLYVTRPNRMVVLDAQTGDILDEIALAAGASLWGIDIDVNNDPMTSVTKRFPLVLPSSSSRIPSITSMTSICTVSKPPPGRRFVLTST